MNELNPQQQQFVLHYLTNNFNATKAAELAGYSENGSSVQGSRLLANAIIQKAIQEYLDQEIIDKQELMYRLSMIAKNRVADFIDTEGNVDLAGIKESGLMFLVREVQHLKSGKVKVVFYDSLKALESLAKVHDMIKDNSVEIRLSAEEQFNQKLAEIRRKLNA